MSENKFRNNVEALRVFCINAPLIVAKQHVFCCVVFPLLSGMIGGSVGAALHTESAELAAGAIATPIVTFGVMAFEQWRHDRKKHEHAHDHNCDGHPRILTAKKFLLQTAIGYGLFFGIHAAFDHDDHSSIPHPVQQTTSQRHVSYKL